MHGAFDARGPANGDRGAVDGLIWTDKHTPPHMHAIVTPPVRIPIPMASSRRSRGNWNVRHGRGARRVGSMRLSGECLDGRLRLNSPEQRAARVSVKVRHPDHQVGVVVSDALPQFGAADGRAVHRNRATADLNGSHAAHGRLWAKQHPVEQRRRIESPLDLPAKRLQARRAGSGRRLGGQIASPCNRNRQYGRYQR